MKQVAERIEGYTYGISAVPAASVTMQQLRDLKITVGWTEDDEQFLSLAGEVLADQTQDVVHRWRSEIIAGIPNLARHSRSPEGEPLADYLAKSNLRFEQWILDTCTRPYDQHWLNYQQEIALRHTSLKKNAVDGVKSTSHVPFRDIIAFLAVMNETIKPFLGNKGHSAEIVERMHGAWCKSMQLQLALWAKLYSETRQAANEW
jgi:hypothetical protein